MARDRDFVVDELRQATRFAREPGTENAVIWTTLGEEILADVRDESLGGLALYLEDVARFPVGREFNIVYAGQLMSASVRHVEPQPEGGFVVGFQCELITAS